MIEKEMYGNVGEFYDVLSEDQWNKRKKIIIETLQTFYDVEGVILDIGAGTGHGSFAALEAIPNADVIALEPSPTMRTALMSRIMRNPRAREHITVIPTTLETFSFPDSLRAVLILGSIGFIDETTRKNLWNIISQKLAKNGGIIFDVMWLDKPQTIKNLEAATVKIGNNEYKVLMNGEPIDSTHQKWMATYQIINNGNILHQITKTSIWRTLSLTDIENEAKPFGFSLEQLTFNMIPTAIMKKNI